MPFAVKVWGKKKEEIAINDSRSETITLGNNKAIILSSLDCLSKSIYFLTDYCTKNKVNKHWSPVSCSHQQLWKQLLFCFFASYLMLFKTAAEKLCCVFIASGPLVCSQDWHCTPSQAMPGKALFQQQDTAGCGLTKASLNWSPHSLIVHWASSLAFQITVWWSNSPGKRAPSSNLLSEC